MNFWFIMDIEKPPDKRVGFLGEVSLEMRTLLDDSGILLDVQDYLSPAYVRQNRINKSKNKVNNKKPVSTVSNSKIFLQ